MKIIKPSQLPSNGTFICIYGESGVGKTFNSLKSLPKKLAYIPSEPRDFARTFNAIGITDKDADIITYEGFEDLMETITKVENFKGYSSILHDSLSYSMTIDLAREISEESYDTKKDKEKLDKPIATRLKLSQPGIGTVNKAVFRILEAYGKLAAYGKTVVVTCLEKSNPKWNRELAAAPALSGREVPDNFPGFFDLIGYVFPKLDKDGNVVYPPAVSFASDGSYLAKATGDLSSNILPLNFTKILSNKK